MNRVSIFIFDTFNNYYRLDEENIPQTVDSNTIIISTNLAGRGTDINTTDNVEANGGLHVIVTFLPRNQRVQDQAFGRSARKGKKGTCQLVLNKEEVELALNRSISDNADIFKFRDEKESKYQINLQNKYLNETYIKDELFSKFSQMINSNEKFINDRNHRKAVIELWALFIISIEHEQQQEIENISSDLQK